jgi:hypothetical protein
MPTRCNTVGIQRQVPSGSVAAVGDLWAYVSQLAERFRNGAPEGMTAVIDVVWVILSSTSGRV